MEEVTETEVKLRDAAIQLQLAVNNTADEDVFRSCINSFISASRSITMIMEKESSGNAELLDWYKKNTEQFATDPVMRFFNEQRVHSIHRGNVKPKSESIPLRNTSTQDAASEATVSIWVFDNAKDFLPDETGNVFRMCEGYLSRLSRMVGEWRYLKAITESPREVIDLLQGERSRLRGQILAMRSELEQAKLTLGILNGMLKRKGDNSEDEFVTSLTLRIERILNPEYFANAPAAKPKEGTIAFNDTGSLEIYTILVSPTEADASGAEGVYATIRNDYAKDENDNPIFNKDFGFFMWGTRLKGRLPPGMSGFGTAKDAENAALAIYKTLRY